MGKRSSFERVEKDYYRTIDPRAVAALATHLPKPVTYVEPCAGKGDLIESLYRLGHTCVRASDISPSGYGIDRRDALTLEYAYPAQCIITNPPWSRPILHRMIEHFVKIADYAWLLFDADWAHTRQSATYMPYCTHIVSVGRLVWIPGTNTSGKDNCAWYRFSRDGDGLTRFVGRS